MIIDQHHPIVEKYYGAGNMRSVIKRLLEECDRVVRSTLEAWREDRSIKRKVESFPFPCSLTEFNFSQLSDVSNSMVSTSTPRKQFSTTVDMDEVDPREIDKTLSEIAGMSGRWNLFRKFLVEQLQVCTPTERFLVVFLDNHNLGRGGGKCGQGSRFQRPEPTTYLWIFQPLRLFSVAH